MAINTVEPQSPEVQAPGARSVIYKALSSVFRSPGPPFWQQLESGQLAAALAEAAAALPYQLQVGGELSLGQGLGLQDLEGAYLALFEVGEVDGSRATCTRGSTAAAEWRCWTRCCASTTTSACA